MSKTLLITGANRGIGFEMARQAAMSGDQVIACARNIKKASNLLALANDHVSITLYSLDVTDENNAISLVVVLNTPYEVKTTRLNRW